MFMRVLHVFTIDITPKSFFDGQFRYLHDKGQFQLYLVSASPKDINFCERNRIKYHQIKIVRKISILDDLKAIRNLINYIKSEKIEVVFGHTPKGALIAMIASKICRIRNRIYFRHGLIYTTSKGLKKSILKFIERFTAKLSSKIINVSHSLCELAIKQHLNSKSKQTIIGSGTCGGVDAFNLFNPENVKFSDIDNLKNKFHIKKSDFVVGFCGRICKEKGIRELIDSFDIFQKVNPTISSKLLIVGEYDERDILPDDYVNKIKQNNYIIKTGFIPKDKLPIYYSIMDVLVLPSYREGFGMTVLEAGAMKVPALVSKSHGCIESIIEGKTGLYIEIDPMDISQNLVRFIDKEYKKTMGEESRKHVMTHYDQSVIWPKMLDFYKSLEI